MATRGSVPGSYRWSLTTALDEKEGRPRKDCVVRYVGFVLQNASLVNKTQTFHRYRLTRTCGNGGLDVSDGGIGIVTTSDEDVEAIAIRRADRQGKAVGVVDGRTGTAHAVNYQ